MRRSLSVSVLACIALVAGACNAAPSGTPAGGGATPIPGTPAAGSPAASPSAGGNTGQVGGKLVIDNESGSTWTCQFNPFNPSVSGTSVGFIYEPLEFVDALKTNPDGSNVTTPWLASASQWNADFTSLTFTIRDGVQWSDGSPFSADDVVYTFNALKADPAIDLNALWKEDGGPLTGVSASGNQVTFTFSGPSQTFFYYLADQVPIVPQHLWSKEDQTKLDSFDDSAPVGTGPYTMANCAQDNIQYMRNDHYWQSTADHPVPQIQEVDYPSFLSNDPANLLLAQGGAQWGAQYIPNIDQFYVAKDPTHRHYWFPPLLNVAIFPNLENSLLSNKAVRQAIAYAIDRSGVSQRGESGYQPAANQTGIVLPTYQSWYDQSADTTKFDVSMATSTLEAAGFTKGADGIYKDANGKRLSFTIKTISGYTDWDSSIQVIQGMLKAAGIEISNILDEDSGVYTTDLQKGNFELAYGEETGGPLPYYELRQMLLGANIGQTNYSRYKVAATDQLLNSYASSSASDQVNIIHQIESVMANDIPVIPVTEGVDWYQYDTTSIGGWPTPDDPYAQPPVWATPDNGVVLTHLYPTQ
ncbi:MAG TPA: ABC transporter substrate-binding protein [Candidatus Limnocylindrales bacterium]|nr:ABC transporter substrate-binding protein [Candidatus Limnocylindrales bacterium]